jgi:hypothetical protein
MSLTDFHRFKELARQENVVFFYTGYFSQSIVTAMGDSLRLRWPAWMPARPPAASCFPCSWKWRRTSCITPPTT